MMMSETGCSSLSCLSGGPEKSCCLQAMARVDPLSNGQSPPRSPAAAHTPGPRAPTGGENKACHSLTSSFLLRLSSSSNL